MSGRFRSRRIGAALLETVLNSPRASTPGGPSLTHGRWEQRVSVFCEKCNKAWGVAKLAPVHSRTTA